MRRRYHRGLETDADPSLANREVNEKRAKKASHSLSRQKANPESLNIEILVKVLLTKI